MREQAVVKLSDLEDALLFVGGADVFDNAAWLCRATGAVLCHSDEGDHDELLTNDIDGANRYVPIPDQHERGLRKPLALAFTRALLPDCVGRMYDIFSHRGACVRFKDRLDRRESLGAWYQYEQDKTRDALRRWCADNGIPVTD